MDVADTPIVVVAPRLPERPGEQAYSATGIDPIRIGRVTRLDEALVTIPGVALFRRNESGAAHPTTQGLSVRSLGQSGGGRALVLLDGVPLSDPFGGWVIWGALPPDTVAGARVLRGAGAGSYGAGALTGMIALQERDAPGWGLSLEGGERGRQRAAAFGEAGNERWDFMLASVVENDDGWIPVHHAGDADSALSLSSTAAVARAQARWGGNLPSLRISGYDEDRGSGLAGADSAAHGATASLTFVSDPRDGVFSWRMQGWVAESDLESHYVSVAPDRTSTTPSNEQIATPARGWGVNAAGRWTYADAGLELGIDARAADGETHEFFRFRSGAFTRYREAGGESLLAGLYMETWRRFSDTLLTGGLRADQWRAKGGFRTERDTATNTLTLDLSPADNNEIAITGRFGLRQNIGDDLYLRGALYRGFRPPTLNELHRPFRVGNDVTEANAMLTPEYLWGADIGFGGATSHITWDAGLFYNLLDDPILNVTLGAGPGTFPPDVFVPAGGVYRQRRNGAAIEAVGAEGNLSIDLGDTLSARLAVDYTNARAGNGLRAAQSPLWAATAGVDWRYDQADVLSLEARFESARFDDDLNTRTLDGYLAFDLRWQHTLAGGSDFFVALDNATDADIQTASTADGVLSYARPRRLRVGIALRSR